MKKINILIIKLCISLYVVPVFSYELDTHAKLSGAAYEHSMLKFNNYRWLQFLGLNGSERFANSLGLERDIPDIIADGARFEDHGSRPTKHFFNPLTGSGIDPFKSSPEFMLTDFLGEGQRGGRLSEHESYTNSRGKIT